MLWAIQQIANDLIVSIARLIIQKILLLDARRWQADQIEIEPPQQDLFIRQGKRHQFFLLMFVGQKSIDRIDRPLGVFHRSNGPLFAAAEKPNEVSDRPESLLAARPLPDRSTS